MKRFFIVTSFIICSALHSISADTEITRFLTATLETGTSVSENLFPKPNLPLNTRKGKTLLKESKRITLNKGMPTTEFAGFYFYSERFQTGKLSLNITTQNRLFIDGKKAEFDKDFPIYTGQHRVLIQIFNNGNSSEDLTLILKGADVTVSLTPEKPITHNEYTRLISPSHITGSPFGNIAAVTVTERAKNGKRRSSLWIADPDTGKVLQKIEKASSPVFLQDNKHLIYVSGKSIYKTLISSYSPEKIFAFDSSPSSLTLSKDGSFIVFSISSTHKEDKDKAVDIMTRINHRLTDWKTKQTIFALSLDGTVLRKLTDPIYLNSFDINNSQLITIETDYIDQFPWTTWSICLTDLSTLKKQTLATLSNSVNSIRFASESLAVFTGQREDYNTGEKINYYETTLYGLNLITGKTAKLTEQLNATMGLDIIYNSQTSDTLSVRDGTVTFLVTEDGRGQVYQYSMKHRTYKRLVSPNCMVTGFSQCKDTDNISFIGSTIDSFPALYTKGTPVLEFQDMDFRSRAELSPFETFTFKSSSGYHINNTLIYPAHFDKSRTYPLIVFYYGGVLPCSFGFHPTFQWLSGNGYAVLITTPRGAVGRGQQFANEHSDEWGEKSAADLIEATEQTVNKYHFIDEQNIGAYSGSYGGFLAMDLATKNHPYKTLISLYGISNLASYWGAGNWGYLYGMSAMPFSFPWNAKDVFVEKSPLFHADKIKTPILLMHGDSDTNVPVVESDQMFTALKILGRDSAYVRFRNEDHGMKGTFENWLRQEDFVIAWFDRFLRNNPGMWNYMVDTYLEKPVHKPLKEYFSYNGEE